MEFRAGAGLIRLEAVMPGVIRVVHTMADVVAPPSAIASGEGVPAERDAFWSVKRDGDGGALRSGDLCAAYDASTGCVTWSEAGGAVLLREAGHELTPQDVVRYTTGGEAPVIDKVKTVDGERSFIRNLKPVQDRRAWRATLRLRFAPDEGIHGFGQGEEGVWDHRGRTTYLYQHNMRIPMPFFLSDRGYGLLVDCGALMTFDLVCLGLLVPHKAVVISG